MSFSVNAVDVLRLEPGPLDQKEAQIFLEKTIWWIRPVASNILARKM